LTATIGLFAVAPTVQAQAAVPPAGRISACFTFSWGGKTGVWTNETSLDAYGYGAWLSVGRYIPAKNGCLSILVPSGYNWRFRVSTRPYANSGDRSMRNVYCSAIINSAYVQTGYSYNLGNVRVTCA
jgi:hypothetical protein